MFLFEFVSTWWYVVMLCYHHSQSEDEFISCFFGPLPHTQEDEFCHLHRRFRFTFTAGWTDKKGGTFKQLPSLEAQQLLWLTSCHSLCSCLFASHTRPSKNGVGYQAILKSQSQNSLFGQENIGKPGHRMFAIDIGDGAIVHDAQVHVCRVRWRS